MNNFNKIPSRSGETYLLNQVPLAKDPQQLPNATAPNGNFTNQPYFKPNKYSLMFNNQNNNHYKINGSMYQNTTDSRFVRGNDFSLPFYPDVNHKYQTQQLPTRKENAAIYHNKTNPHYPEPGQNRKYNPNYKIYPNQSNYLKKFPFFSIPYYEHLTDSNLPSAKSNFIKLCFILPVIILFFFFFRV